MDLTDQRLYSILFRPTEVQDFWAVVLGGRVDFKTLLTDRDALIRFILEATGRDNLIVGEIKELNEWSPTGGQGMNSSIQDSVCPSFIIVRIQIVKAYLP